MAKVTTQESKKTAEGYLRFLLDLVYHGDLRVPALVHLADVARDELSNAQVGVAGEVQVHPVGLQQLPLSGALSQCGRSPRLNKCRPGDYHVWIIRWLSRAGGLRVSRRFGSCLISWSGGFGSGGSWRFLICCLRLRQLRLFDLLGFLRPLGEFGLGTERTETLSTKKGK